MAELAGKIAIVTGAAGGMGRAIWGGLAKAGATVIPVDLGGDGCFHADVGTDAGNRAMIAHAVETHGGLDILVLNAGVQYIAPLAEFPEEQWDRLINVMAKGPFLAIRAAWPHLTDTPGKRVIVTSSTSALGGGEYKVAYTAAKWAVTGVVKTAAREGAAHGLTVNAIAPGWVHTGMVDDQLADQMKYYGRTREEILAGMAAEQPAGRFVAAEEIAATVLFLASPAASGINGVLLPVDLGGSA